MNFLQRNKIAIVLFGVMIITPLIYLSFFVYPSADDFSYAVAYKDLSFFQKQKAFYLDWTSRYFATAILSLSFLNFRSIHYYGIFSIISLLLFYFGLVYVLKKVIVSKYINTWFFGVLILGSYILFLPAICENFYWLPSVITYFVPSALFLFLVGNTLNLYNNQNVKNTVVAVLLIFIIGGCNELLTGIVGLWLLTLLFFYYTDNRKLHLNYLGLLFLTGLITAFVVLAPGNEVRANVINSIKLISLYEIVKLSFIQLFIIYVKYLIWIFLLFVFINTFFKIRIYLHSKINIFNVFLTMNLLLWLSMFITIHSLKMRYPIRVENLLYFISIVFLYVLSVLVVEKLRFNKKLLFSVFISLAALILLPFIHKTFKNNIQLIYSDIMEGKAIDYKKQFLERDNYLQNYNFKEGIPCKVLTIKNPPETLMFKDITTNKASFINRSIAKYYNIEAIVAED